MDYYPNAKRHLTYPIKKTTFKLLTDIPPKKSNIDVNLSNIMNKKLKI